MSEQIKHECGLAFIRLLKPLNYYHEKYGTALYGLQKLQLLLQKQRNRGQDGAGLATIKLDATPGKRYISRKRVNTTDYIKDLFDQVYANFQDLPKDKLNNPEWLKENMPYMGEVLLGHLRYGTHGSNSIETVHPFIRSNNWINRNIIVAGNFNLTNVKELFEELVALGQYPKEKSDTVTVLEKIGHFLDDEVLRLHSWFKPEGYTPEQLNKLICDNLDLQRMLQRATRKFDGGYVMAGMIGHGDAFILRDSNGIRPAYYYQDDEIVAVASERPAIQTALNVSFGNVKELQRGHALIIKKDGRVTEDLCKDQGKALSCSFERIYFSRGTDKVIYEERKMLGKLLAHDVLDAVDHDIENTIFSFIPNTAETAFYGLVKGVEEVIDLQNKEKLLQYKGELTPELIDKMFKRKLRFEKIAVKDAKMRTFIADDRSREDMVSHVYDVTYGVVRNNIDNLVLIDDSIVRGTTLRDSIIKIISRLQPKKIVIVSSAPQIRYPDCYGIDMSKMKEFAAFRALIALLEENNKNHLLEECYQKSKAQENAPAENIQNYVKDLYDQFTYDQVTEKISEMLTPTSVTIPVQIIYQSLENLHKSCPDHPGDWYFSGNYPTPGGNRIVNKAFINYMEKVDSRAY